MLFFSVVGLRTLGSRNLTFYITFKLDYGQGSRSRPTWLPPHHFTIQVATLEVGPPLVLHVVVRVHPVSMSGFYKKYTYLASILWHATGQRTQESVGGIQTGTGESSVSAKIRG